MKNKWFLIVLALVILLILTIYYFNFREESGTANPLIVSPPQQTAIIKISSDKEGSWANIASTEHSFIEDSSVPATVEVPIGKYVVIVHKDGYLNCTNEITTLPGKIYNINCVMKPSDYDLQEGAPI